MQYVYQGKVYDRAGIEQALGRVHTEAAVLVTGTGLPRRNTAYVFPNERSCNAWAQKLAIASSFKTYHARLKQARALPTSPIDPIIQLQRRKLRRAEASLKELSKRTGLPLHSKELFLRATINANILEGPVTDPARVYRNPGFTGANAFIVAPVPDLGLLSPSLNNSISSIRVVGTCGLFNGTLWRGTSVLFIGLPYTEEPDFNLVVPATGPFANFNNLASSILVGPIT
jgi:hypothetical protein